MNYLQVVQDFVRTSGGANLAARQQHGERDCVAAGKIVGISIAKRNGEVNTATISQHELAAMMNRIKANTREGFVSCGDGCL